LIAYSLSKVFAKNYQHRLMCVEVIVCYISVVFLGARCSRVVGYICHLLTAIIIVRQDGATRCSIISSICWNVCGCLRFLEVYRPTWNSQRRGRTATHNMELTINRIFLVSSRFYMAPRISENVHKDWKCILVLSGIAVCIMHFVDTVSSIVCLYLKEM